MIIETFWCCLHEHEDCQPWMQGFFTACAAAGGSQALKMCRMPPRLRLDTPWPSHKAALRATPAAVSFCADVQLYAVLVTRQVSLMTKANPSTSIALSGLLKAKASDV